MSTSESSDDSASPTTNSIASMAIPPRKASLLGLPRELRDEIWTQALVPEASPSNHLAARGTRVCASASPGLLRTNRQIRHDASMIFYCDTFHANTPSECKAWIQCFGAAIPVKSVKVQVRTLSPYCFRGTREWMERALRALEGVVDEVGANAHFEFCIFAGASQERWMTLKEIEGLSKEEGEQRYMWSVFEQGDFSEYKHEPKDELEIPQVVAV